MSEQGWGRGRKRMEGWDAAEGEGKIGMREREAGNSERSVHAARARVQVGFMLACVALSIRAGIMGSVIQPWKVKETMFLLSVALSWDGIQRRVIAQNLRHCRRF